MNKDNNTTGRTSAAIEHDTVLAPVVKLLSMWALDSNYAKRTVDDDFISHGIWETRGLETKDNGTLVYTLVCVWSNHENLNVGAIRLMSREQILWLCHPVKFEHMPKVPFNRC